MNRGTFTLESVCPNPDDCGSSLADTSGNYMLTIPLNETWDWKLKDNESQHITIDTTRKNDTNPDTGTPIPSLFRGYMFHGPDNSSAVYRFAGTNYMYNESFEGYVGPESSSYPLWTFNFNSSGSSWDQYNIAQPWLPNHGAGIDAIDHGVGFYLNGQIDMGTSAKTLGALKDITQSLYMPVEGMLIIDLVNFSSKNISSSDLRGGAPRVGGTMEYIASVGDSGILVALGGQIQPAREGGQKANRSEGELVSQDKHPSPTKYTYQSSLFSCAALISMDSAWLALMENTMDTLLASE